MNNSKPALGALINAQLKQLVVEPESNVLTPLLEQIDGLVLRHNLGDRKQTAIILPLFVTLLQYSQLIRDMSNLNVLEGLQESILELIDVDEMPDLDINVIKTFANVELLDVVGFELDVLTVAPGIVNSISGFSLGVLAGMMEDFQAAGNHLALWLAKTYYDVVIGSTHNEGKSLRDLINSDTWIDYKLGLSYIQAADQICTPIKNNRM